LNNSPQIEAATDGRPLTRYAANSRSNGAARRVWRLGWRTREFEDQGWRTRSLETKDGERESLETKDGDREIMETSLASPSGRALRIRLARSRSGVPEPQI